MTTPLKPMDREAWEKRLKEIEARTEAATPGPWIGGTMPTTASCAPEPLWFWSNLAPREIHYDRSTHLAPRDGFFIARARQDIPDLVAHVRALQSQLTDALAEVERLRAAIDLSHKTLKDAPEINARRIDNRPPDIGCDFVLWVKGAGYDDSFVLRNPRMNNGYAECILRALESVGEVQKILREARQPK